ncbi:RsmB/NOP family class I SAM-dependent RNA methyltransferase [Desulfovibrio litoralis]|uniref:16S rRNA (Cytosine967-C5)-methyltransferase n=1 Tax=Desulfovibrio litoralis DSM 11393 TaxID=1121455 RepID=A0A1M7SS50_9BACT|nr:transcription antitermination factor NusB [Desulfovibrio litoralis]SHN61312.1 16S rRNA (cytosine967-C5)-methyltransferase [Desulfovibrio litoralis DSM 11393]
MPHKSLIQNSGSARECAVKVLTKVILKKEELQATLDNTIKIYKSKTELNFSEQDTALTTELSYGCLRKYQYISELLKKFLQKPNKLPDTFKIRLTIAVYELLFLKGTPDYASLYLHVQGIKAEHGQKLANVANAVLREIQRLGEKVLNIDYFKTQEPQLDQLSIYSAFYSMPLWIVKLWFSAYGEEQALLLLKGSSTKAPLGLRVNLNHKDAQSLINEIKDHANYKIHNAGFGFQTLPSELKAKLNLLQKEGQISRQSAASQEILWEFNTVWEACKKQQNKNKVLWDACAGHGGKCTALAEQNVPVSLASDLSFSRLKGLKKELLRLNLSIPIARLSVPYAALKQKFDAILLDAPCSGLGTLSRHPDIALNRKPEDLTRLIQTQAKMLSHCIAQLENSGHLIYITCTLNPAENEEQIEKVLQENPELKLIKTWHTPYDSPFNEFFWAAHLQKS